MRTLVSIALVVCFAGTAAGGGRWSQRWLAVAPAAARTTSGRWTMDATLEAGPSGAVSSCAQGVAASVSGPARLAAPGIAVRLVLDRDGADPDIPRLSWTGSASSFVVYRDDVAGEVGDAITTIDAVQACEYLDAAAPPIPLLFYLVTPASAGVREVP